MELIGVGGYNLRNLGRLNILLGKNGCGKSRLLKQVEQAMKDGPTVGALRYISPERAGLLQYEANIEQNMTNSPTWLADSRRHNQAQQFRQQSTAQFRRLELLVLRALEKDPELRQDPTYTFDTVVDRINTLLDRVLLERGGAGFIIKDRRSGETVAATEVSSGESELISLGIECLVFVRECVADRQNLLLLDEPDVHLHPDLQARFGRFLRELMEEAPFTLVLATHSTAFLSAASADAATRIAFLRYGDTDIAFKEIDYTLKRILPVFGAHPLSNVFNEAPVLLVEGEDDERIWQQAVRSANGRIAVYPVAVDNITNLGAFEQEVALILDAVYDNAVGYSLRDRDEGSTEIDDVGSVRRFRLNARAAENLLLSDDVLGRAGVTWAELQGRVSSWVAGNATHPHFGAISIFASTWGNRRDANLKEIRNDLVGMMGSSKPWEVMVGQSIAALVLGDGATGPDSLREYLGAGVCNALLGVN
ncbi:MAG: AAA family ATPase [Gemmatimonadaceae bacterium]